MERKLEMEGRRRRRRRREEQGGRMEGGAEGGGRGGLQGWRIGKGAKESGRWKGRGLWFKRVCMNS